MGGNQSKSAILAHIVLRIVTYPTFDCTIFTRLLHTRHCILVIKAIIGKYSRSILSIKRADEGLQNKLIKLRKFRVQMHPMEIRPLGSRIKGTYTQISWSTSRIIFQKESIYVYLLDIEIFSG